MLKAKSLGIDKNLTNDTDFTPKKLEVNLNGTYFETPSNSLITYSHGLVVFGGAINAKETHTFDTDATLFTVSKGALFPYARLIGNNDANNYHLYVNSLGEVKTYDKFTLNKGAYLTIYGSYFTNPEWGGVTLKGLLHKIKHFFHREEVLV